MPHAERQFAHADQLAFASLSGDFNPLHVDAVYARRSLAGEAVVHGIHLLLWALDRWQAGQGGGAWMLSSLDVAFLKPVTVGASVRLESGGTAAAPELQVFIGSTLMTTIEFTWQAGADGSRAETGVPPHGQPRELDAAALAQAAGILPLHWDAPAAAVLFPHLAATLAASQGAALLASTRVVGMEAPGLHSLYSELHFEAGANQASAFDYRVKRFDTRFSLASIAFEAPGLAGTIKAFLRPRPQCQPDSREVRATLAGQPYEGQKALVVGGSRGIGEVFAKVLAMGGAEVMLTYHRGQAEAEAIVADIRAAGGKAACMAFDVTGTPPAAKWPATHVYFMATPHIGKGQRGEFDAAAFARFCQYYVEGFQRVFAWAQGPALSSVYYPSTVFLDELPADMPEYIAAKGAGEMLCALLRRAEPAVHVACPRLPRLATDQTASLLPVATSPVLPLVLAQLEQFNLEAA